MKLFFCEIGLFTLHNCCVSWLLNILKLKLDFQSRLTIPEISGYHCSFQVLTVQSNVFEMFLKYFTVSRETDFKLILIKNSFP